MSHRSGLPFCWAVLVLLGVCSLMLFAQDNPQSGQTGNHPTVSIPLQLNLTGCLKKSASGAYSVTDQNGRTWELTSQKTDLAKYVFQTVSVSGHPSTEARKQEGQSEESQSAKAGGNQYFGLDVTEITVVSPSCTR
ncbi:MAG: hypothetical protein WCC92_20080 [Candidatus Korobacteraceae bacterium]